MVRSRYPLLIQQRHRWFVRMVVPPEVRDIVGQAIFKIATGETDPHRAATIAAPIIADLRRRIQGRCRRPNWLMSLRPFIWDATRTCTEKWRWCLTNLFGRS